MELSESETVSGAARYEVALQPAHEGAACDYSVLEAADVAKRLASNIEQGLSSAAASERRARFGSNELAAAAPLPVWRRVLEQLHDPLVYLLLGAVAVSFAAWVFEGAHSWPFEAIVVFVIVVANALLGYLEEAKAERAVAALSRMSAATALVLRDGTPERVPGTEVVPGDILILAEGDAVAADARLLSAASLEVAEASLTGESAPVVKRSARLEQAAALADRVNMVYKGTAVSRGAGRAVVVATGMSTEMGRIAHLLAQTEEEPTPLEREIQRVGRSLGIAVMVIAMIVIGTVLVISRPQSPSGYVEVLLLGVSLAVAAVPEGLPAVLSLVLAVGVQRMAGKKAIVKRLSSVETLGSTSVICSDKTGALTRNEMTIERIVTRSGEVRVTGTGYRPEGALMNAERPLSAGDLRAEVESVLSWGSLANSASLREGGGEWIVSGDPTDLAFLVAERKGGFHQSRERRYEPMKEVPFSSERKLMSSVVIDREQNGRLVIVTKGAPDVLLDRCDRERSGAGEEPLSDQRRMEIRAHIDRLSDAALRTIAVAYRALDDAERPSGEGSGEELERNLAFAGMVGMLDPARPEALSAIGEARAAGVRTIMITGDHPRTAARIAETLRIAPASARVCTGLDLARMDSAELVAAARESSVFARVAPEHKLRIVDALQADGAVVAMTGDGVNDAPALKSADIGIAMGITGTDVTKEAAKMILADDNFATIVTALREGRLIFDNIEKFLRYLLSSNIGEVLTVFLGIVGASWLGLHQDDRIVAPLLATQILWINLLTDTAPALALGVDRPTGDVMARPPRARTQPIIGRSMQLSVLYVGTVMAVATLLMLDMRLPGGLIEGSASVEEARTSAFTVLVLAQLFNCFNSRSQHQSALSAATSSPLLWGAVAVSLILQVLVVSLPILNRAFQTRPLPLSEWLLCGAMASSVLWATELEKLVIRASRRRSRGGVSA